MPDFCVIGAGVVGLATAMTLQRRHPGAGLVVIEKENGVSRHQTGHNSGVIHSGIYYAPGSLKAELCRRGAEETKEFCRTHDVPFETCGKLLVATDEAEIERMEALYKRSKANKVAVERIDAAELARREPHIKGLGALFVPSTGIVDYRRVSEAMADEIRRNGGEIAFGQQVDSIHESPRGVHVKAGERQWAVERLIACAGLQSDRLARCAGLRTNHQIVPFRGEYYRLPPAKAGIAKALIYPIPDPDLPFLGIHLTRMIDGSMTVGPNAVLGMAREGYPKFSFNAFDVATYARFPGFWKVIGKNLRSGISEMLNSLFKARYLAQCRKYCPELTLADLMPHEAGIRAQAVMADGTLVHDFLFLKTERMLHVCNAPSPAATSAIPISEMIVGQALEQEK